MSRRTARLRVIMREDGVFQDLPYLAQEQCRRRWRQGKTRRQQRKGLSIRAKHVKFPERLLSKRRRKKFFRRDKRAT